MNLESEPPRLAVRCTTFFGWAIPVYIFFTLMAFREHLLLNPIFLLLCSVLGVALAVPGTIQVLKLRDKKESKLTAILLSIPVVIVLIGLLELKKRGIFVWNELYLVVPFLLFSLVFYVACLLAEDKNFIRVYLGLDGIHYVPAA